MFSNMFIMLYISDRNIYLTQRFCCIKFPNDICVIRRNLRGSPLESKNLAYTALVRSGMEKAAPIWDPATQKGLYQTENSLPEKSVSSGSVNTFKSQRVVKP